MTRFIHKLREDRAPIAASLHTLETGKLLYIRRDDGEGRMWRWWQSAGAACGSGLLLLCCPAALSAAPCDQYDPAGPARSALITLNSGDFVDERREEIRSFIATGSIGKVDVAVVSSTPGGIVRGVSATPEVSRFSPHYGEQLKGIAIAVALRTGAGPATVVLNLRQVCAEYFRNTVLYY
jgi:hypothetical protein